MPLIDQDQVSDNLSPYTKFIPKAEEQEEEEEQESPGILDTLGAAFKLYNTVGSSIANEREVVPDLRPLEEGYDPFTANKGTPYESNPEAFIDVKNEEDRLAVIAQQDKEGESHQILNASGWTGAVAIMGAGIFDPAMLMPGANMVKAGKMIKAAAVSRAAKGAGIGAVSASTAVAAQESILQQTQVTRTSEQSVKAVLAAGIFGGMLGGAIGAATKGLKPASEHIIKKTLSSEDIKIKIGDDGKLTVHDSSGGKSVDYITLKEGEGIARMNSFVTKAFHGSPTVRNLDSAYFNTRAYTNDLFNHNYILNKNLDYVPTQTNVEAQIIQDATETTIMNSLVKKIYLDEVAHTSKGVLSVERAAIGARLGKYRTYDQFNEQIAKAMRNGTTHSDPAVKKAAELIRKNMTDRALKMQKLGLLDDTIDAARMSTYLSRVYNIPKILANRRGFEDILVQDFVEKGMATAEARRIVIDSVDNIIGNGNSQMEMASLIDKTINATTTKASKQKMLLIDDSKIDEFLVNNALGISNKYLASSSALIRFKELLAKKGLEDLAGLKKLIKEEHTQLMARKSAIQEELPKATGAKAKQLKKELKGLPKDDSTLTKMVGQGGEIDKLTALTLGQWTKRGKGDGFLQGVRHYQTLTKLGGVTIASLPDLVMASFKHGLHRTIRDGYVPMVRNFKKSKLAGDDLADFNVGMQGETSVLLKALVDSDEMVKGSLAKFNDSMVAEFGKLTGLNAWNNFHRRMAGRVSQARTIRALHAWENGRISNKEKVRLATLGYGEQHYKRMLGQFKKHGEEVDGSYISNHKNWEDREIVDIMASGVMKDVDSTVLVPSKGDIPLTAQSSELWKTTTQYKNFMFAATTKILLSGMQRRDADALSGVIGLVFMGSMVYIAKEKIAGREPNMDIDNLLKEGVARSGVAGLFGDVAFVAVPGLSSTKYASNNIYSFLGGPSAGTLVDSKKLLDGIAKDGIDDKDIAKATKFLPYQNLFWLQGTLNQLNDKDKKGLGK